MMICVTTTATGALYRVRRLGEADALLVTWDREQAVAVAGAAAIWVDVRRGN
jgi:hypothetical protein